MISPLALVNVTPTFVDDAGRSTTPCISPLSSGLTSAPGTNTEVPKNCAAVAIRFGSSLADISVKLVFISVIPVTVEN